MTGNVSSEAKIEDYVRTRLLPGRRLDVDLGKRPARRKGDRRSTGLSYKDNPREYLRQYFKQRRAQDPLFCVLQALRGRLHFAARSAKARRCASFVELLDCSVDWLRAHLESQFVVGMSWSNYGQWEIDHIRPCKLFNLSDPAEQRACFHWSNLQPLWMRDNRQKGARYAA